MTLKTLYHILQIVGVIVGIGVGVITFMSYMDEPDSFFDTDLTVHQSTTSSTTTKTWSSEDGEMPDDIKAILEDAKILIEEVENE